MLIHLSRFSRRRNLLIVLLTLSVIFYGMVVLFNKPLLRLLKNPQVIEPEHKIDDTLSHTSDERSKHHASSRKSYLDDEKSWSEVRKGESSPHAYDKSETMSHCRLSNCFDIHRCQPGQTISIHIYPEPWKVSSVSSTYMKILRIIQNSPYYEPDASKACLFISSFDYLDRDPLSPDFQKNSPSTQLIDSGRNHILFNLYSGTWPDYKELDFLGYNPGYAILVKASLSYQHFRPGFDISLPLFSKNHPEYGKQFILNDGEAEYQANSFVEFKKAHSSLASEQKNLMVFKGKRYTHGIGSETRNMLHHLHNDRDILIYTTCKHGKKWKDTKDERCSRDNQEYDKYDYQTLMSNSTFCLIPRGRRLGSFRFLEALSLGCIPVVLSNDWVKPFDDIIDWTSAVVDGDERSLLQLPEILRSYDWRTITRLRSQSLAIYETYFSSVERIVHTTLKILRERIHSHLAISSFQRNLVNPSFSPFVGAIWFNPSYSLDMRKFPSYQNLVPSSNNSSRNHKLEVPGSFTAVIFVDKPSCSNSILKLIRALNKSQYLGKIILIWALSDDFFPPQAIFRPFLTSQGARRTIEVIPPSSKTIHAKLYLYEEIDTDAILNIDPCSTIAPEEIDFAFLVWKSFPHRMVGFTPRDYYYDDNRGRWFYSSKWSNYFSIVLLDCVFYHRYYSYLYMEFIKIHHRNYKRNLLIKSENNQGNKVSKGPIGHQWEEASLNSVLDDEACIDLTFNFLVSHIIRESPIKVTQRKKTTNSSSINYLIDSSPYYVNTRLDTFNVRQECFTYLYNRSFSYIPLVKSQVRLDPVLFKDHISTFRKKYLRIEQLH
ncbi:exostosin-1c-like [Brevipalpus obovatus]|uniref:exostosin-1c-like n=1 Tax=Brevipalpus obovatus TaxID=246614 RepID=UPI003D9F904C